MFFLPDVRPIRDALKREQFQAVRRWFHDDWMRIERKRLHNVRLSKEFLFSFLSLTTVLH